MKLPAFIDEARLEVIDVMRREQEKDVAATNYGISKNEKAEAEAGLALMAAWGKACKLATRLVEPADAEDIASEVMLSLRRKAEANPLLLTDENQRNSYIQIAVRNRVIDRHRAVRRTRRKEEALAIELRHQPSPEERREAQHQAETIRLFVERTLLTFPIQTQAIWRMRNQGIAPQVIAMKMNLPDTTVWSTINRTSKALEKAWLESERNDNARRRNQ